LEPIRRDDSGPFAPPERTWLPRRKFQDRLWVHRALLLATLITTTLAGAEHYGGFISDFSGKVPQVSMTALFLNGLWYSATILAILGCHELGHYIACRYYDVDASRPFFLPMPFLLTGTLGAFIRIREPIPSKRMLFDIGIAGPIAGFLIAVPALFIGLRLSHVVALPVRLPPGTMDLGEPLLFKLAARLIWGAQPAGVTLNLHPMAFAAWFGLLATALNLFPIGQLDGGHISYAVLGRRSTYVTLVMIGVALGLARFSSSWIVWTGLMVVMLIAFGPRHPRTADEHVPLDRARVALAVFALVMFIVCFTPAPIQPVDLLRR
jgi:membrane-associated protease RseP (regulator of RpoE activity)